MSATVTYHSDSVISTVDSDPFLNSKTDSGYTFRIDMNPYDSSGKYNSTTRIGWKIYEHEVWLYVDGAFVETRYFNASGASYQDWGNNFEEWGHTGGNRGFDHAIFDWDISQHLSRHTSQTLKFIVFPLGHKFNGMIDPSVTGARGSEGGLAMAGAWSSRFEITTASQAFWTWDGPLTDAGASLDDALIYSNINYSDVGNRSNQGIIITPRKSNGSSNKAKIKARIVPNGGGWNDGVVEETFTNVNGTSGFYTIDGLEDHLTIDDYWDENNKVFDIHLRAYTSDDVYVQGHVVQNVPLNPKRSDWIFSNGSSVNANYDRVNQRITKAKFGSSHTSSRSSFHKGRIIVTHPSTNATKTFWFHNWDANGDLEYSNAITFTEAHNGNDLDIGSLLNGNETVDFNVKYDVYLPDSNGYATYTENGSLLHQAYDWTFDGFAPTASISEYTNDSVKCNVSFASKNEVGQNARIKILCREHTNQADVFERWIHPTPSGGTSPGDGAKDGLTYEVQVHSTVSNNSYWSTGVKQFPLDDLSTDTLLDFKVEAYDENDNLLDQTPWATQELWIPRKPQLTMSNVEVDEYEGDGGTVKFDWEVSVSNLMDVSLRPTTMHFWMSGITIGNVDMGTGSSAFGGPIIYSGTHEKALNHLINGVTERTSAQTKPLWGIVFESGGAGDHYGMIGEDLFIRSSFRFNTDNVLDAASISHYNLRESVKALVNVSKIHGKWADTIPSNNLSFQIQFRDAGGKLGAGATLTSNVNSEMNTLIQIGGLWEFPDDVNQPVLYDPVGNQSGWFDESLVNLECRLIAKVGNTQVDTTAWMNINTASTENWNVANKWYTDNVNLTGYCLVSEPDATYKNGRNIIIFQTSHPPMNQGTEDFSDIIKVEIQYAEGASGSWKDITAHGSPGDGVVHWGDLDGSGKRLHQPGFVDRLSQPGNHLVQAYTLDHAWDNDGVGINTDPYVSYRARIVMFDYRASNAAPQTIRYPWNEITMETVYNAFPENALPKSLTGNNPAATVSATHLPGTNDGTGLVPSRLVLAFNSSFVNPYFPDAAAEEKFSYSPRYTFSGAVTEIVKHANAIDDNRFHLYPDNKVTFTNNDIVAANWDLTGSNHPNDASLQGINFEARIPDEAMYASHIVLQIEENLSNESGNWRNIYNTLKDNSHPDVPATIQQMRTYTSDGFVAMNNIANGNLGLVPQDCELVSRNGAYGLSGYTLKFRIPADLDNYYSNIEPKMIVGVRIGYSTTTGVGHSTIVAFRDNGDEEGMGMSHLAGTPVQDVEALKLELLKSLTDVNTPLIEKPDGFIHYDVDMNFVRDVWSYNSNIDISQNITIDFCFYIEEEVTSYLQGLSGNNYFATTGGSYGSSVSVGAADGEWYDVSKWLRIDDVETLNLSTMLTNYKYCEDDQNVGFIDSDVLDTGTITLTEYEPTKLRLVQENHQAASQSKLPFKHSTERILTTFEQTAAGAALRDPFESSKTTNQDTSFATSFSVDKDGYTVDKDVVYTATPKMSTLTPFGTKSWGVGYSDKLKIPTVSPAGDGVITIQNNYFDTFVPDPIPPLEFVANFPEDVTGENDGTSTVNVKFVYNASEFSGTSKYFNTSHEGIKITREMIQGQDLGGGEPWSVAYDGPIFNLSDEAGPDGNKIYTFVDSNIVLQDNTPVGFDENQYYRWKYTLTPYLSYTPGGVTESTAKRDSKEKEGTGLPANLPNTLPRPVNLSFRYNTKHSVLATWEYPTDGQTLQFLENESIDFNFQVFWKAVEEVDYYYENPEHESRERRDKVRDFKYSHKKAPREVSKLNNMKGWTLAGIVPYDKSQDRSGNLASSFSFLINYEKMSFKYGIQIAVIPKIVGDYFSFFSHDISTHASGESVTGVDQYKHPDGILVDPSDKSVRKKLLTEKERMKISDKIAKRNEDFIKHNNLEQVPISVTRRRAQINPLVDPNNEGGFNPYSAT